MSAPRVRKETGTRLELRRATTTRSLFGTAAKPESGRDARELERTSMELGSDQGCSRLLSRELERADLGRSSHNPTATRKRGAGTGRGRRSERSEEASRPRERTILTRKNRTSRGSDRRRRENASIFSAPNSVARRSTREPKKRRARVQLVR